MKDAFKQLLVAILFLVGGLLSPSNGLDDKVERDPVTMLGIAGAVILIALGVHQVYQRYFLTNKK